MDAPPNPNLLADRRWLIGICISLTFGIFGGVMAWLGYVDRRRSAAEVAPPTVTAAAAAPLPMPTPKRHEKNKNGKGHE